MQKPESTEQPTVTT